MYREILSSCLRKHSFELIVYQAHISKSGYDRHQCVLEVPVILTSYQCVAPLLIDTVFYLFFHMVNRLPDVRRYNRCFRHKTLEYTLDRRLQI